MAYTSEQKRIQRKIVRRGQRKLARLPAKERRQAIRSALATGGVESSWRNLGYGDRDSEGWRQERRQYYPNPRNVNASIDRYYDEWLADARGKGLSIGEQAQAVQQSGFPDRYGEFIDEAEDIHRRYARGGKGGFSRGGRKGGFRRTVKRTAGVDNSQLRQQLKLDYLDSRDKPGALLELAGGLDEAADVPGRKVVTTKRVKARRSGGGGGKSGLPNRPNITAFGIGKLAQRHGLSARELPAFDPVDPVHTEGSYHYQKGKGGGRAVDVSGDPKKLAAFYRDVTRKYGKRLSEAFYDPAGYYVKHGKRVKGAIGGHGSHAHFAV